MTIVVRRLNIEYLMDNSTYFHSRFASSEFNEMNNIVDFYKKEHKTVMTLLIPERTQTSPESFITI